MIALVAIAVSAVGWLSYRNLEQALLLRARDRIETHSRPGCDRPRILRGERHRRCRGLSFRGGADRDWSAPAEPGGIRSGRWHLRTDLAQTGWHHASRRNWKPSRPTRCSGSSALDDDGREIVRVDRNGPNGTVRIVPEAQLQKRSDRGYFQETVRLGPTQIYVSPLDLGRDNGLIEEGHGPTLRVATPIFADGGKPFGIFMINVDMRRAFDRVRSVGVAGRDHIRRQQAGRLSHPPRSFARIRLVARQAERLESRLSAFGDACRDNAKQRRHRSRSKRTIGRDSPRADSPGRRRMGWVRSKPRLTPSSWRRPRASEILRFWSERSPCCARRRWRSWWRGR